MRERRDGRETHIRQHLDLALAVFALLRDTRKLSMNVLEPGADASLLDLLLNEPGGERLERLIQEVVLRVADAKFERVDLEDGDLSWPAEERTTMA